MSVLGMRQGKYDTSQKHAIVSESMEVLKKQTKTQTLSWLSRISGGGLRT